MSFVLLNMLMLLKLQKKSFAKIVYSIVCSCIFKYDYKLNGILSSYLNLKYGQIYYFMLTLYACYTWWLDLTQKQLWSKSYSIIESFCMDRNSLIAKCNKQMEQCNDKKQTFQPWVKCFIVAYISRTTQMTTIITDRSVSFPNTETG